MIYKVLRRRNGSHGAMQRALKVSNKILKLTLYLTGNQCKFIKTGVIWSYFLHDISSRAAAFCTLCNLAISQSGNPWRSPLQ